MWNHQPPGYVCPFCAFLRDNQDEHNRTSDVVARDDLVVARISPKWWPGNPGAALVIPVDHHENLYDLPADVGHAIWDMTQRVALAMRTAYRCAGISTRQHNEPAGDQDVWHLHVPCPAALGRRPTVPAAQRVSVGIGGRASAVRRPAARRPGTGLNRDSR